MLFLTSFLFSTVVLHAHYRSEHDIHLLFLIITMMSILFHTISFFDNQNVIAPKMFHVIRLIDKFWAHFAFIYMTFQGYMRMKYLIFVFDILVIFIWWKRLCAIDSNLGIYWHALLHFFLQSLSIFIYIHTS